MRTQRTLATILTIIALLLRCSLTLPQALAQPLAAPTVTAYTDPIFGSPTDSTVTTVSNVSINAVDPRAMWVGSFAPVSGQCMPSTSCCCSNGQPITVVTNVANVHAIDITGVSDGGSGCYYQSSLGGTMSVSANNPYVAFIAYPSIQLNVTATLSNDQQSVTIATTRTTCTVQFKRSVTTAPIVGGSEGGGTGGWGSGGGDSGVAVPSASTSGVNYVSKILLAGTNGNGQHLYTVAFGVGADTPVTGVTMFYTTTTNPANTAVALSLQSPSTVVFDQSQSQRLVYVSPEIAVKDSDTLSYSFLFVRQSQTLYTSAYTFKYDPSLFPPVMPTTTTGSGGGNQQPVLVGQYQTTNDCVPSSGCCCGTGVVTITSTGTRSLTVNGATDNGEGCYGQPSLGGEFPINSVTDTNTNYTFRMSGVSATFSLSLTNNDQLTISNNFQPQCVTRAVRLQSQPVVQYSELQRPFVGSYLFDSTCKTSASCCCAVGALDVSVPSSSTIINTSSLLTLSGALDGSQACAGQTTLSQTFSVTQPYQAQYSLSSLTLTAALSADQTSLSFANNFYPFCISKAKKLSSTSTGANSGSDGGVNFSGIVGNYISDGHCVPSDQCCCTNGVTAITATGDNGFLVATNLDGRSFSCLGADGPVTMMFRPLNVSYASASFDGVDFGAELQSDGSVIIRNTLHPECPTRVLRSSGATGAKSNSASAPAASATAMMLVSAAGTILSLWI